MNLFYHILLKSFKNTSYCLGNIDNLFVNVSQKQNSMSYLINYYFSTIIHEFKNKDKNSLKMKYNQLEELMKNFVVQDKKEEFFKKFSIAQKHYFVLMRFQRLWRIKRSPVQISEDLCGNDLVKSKNSVLIYHERALYYFSISDLISIFKN